MTADKESFLGALISVWLRLSTVIMIGLLFFLALQLPGKLAGWPFFLSPAEVTFEIVVEAVFTAVASVALGAVCAAAVAPILFYRHLSRRRIVERVTGAAVAIVAFIDLALGLDLLLRSANLWGHTKVAIFACYLIAFVAVLWIPRRRKQLVTSLDGYLGERSTRRAVIGTGVAAAALAITEAAIGKTVSAPVMPRRGLQPSGPNILLVTFDALSAEDLSLYGYRVPTTPHIDEFARKSSVFTNFYSASTFTTPSVATMFTGLSPSEHHVYQIQGRFRGEVAVKTLPRAMRAGGYFIGASISNPRAYFLAEGIAEDYDALPDPPYGKKDVMPVWDATRFLHQREAFGSRTSEFFDLEDAWLSVPGTLAHYNPRLFADTKSRFPPAGSFEQARQMLGRMPDKFFMWVHVFAPHNPYLPDAENRRRFLPVSEKQAPDDPSWSDAGPSPEARLRYDEFIADADSAFGAFLGSLERSGRLRNTAVIVSADHGESFEGGIYGHGYPFQVRPEIHVPLIIRMPGEERGARMDITADQTSLAPTILEIAGIPRADWMHGPSLLPWLNRNGEGGGEGLAFTQYLATNSIFKPLTHGTVGVIDGRHQYVLDLNSGKGILRGLDEAQMKDLDRSAENPALAQTLRDAIYARFPDLPRKPA